MSEFEQERPIKRPGQAHEFTPVMVAELLRCQKDPIYFITAYVWLQHPEAGRVPFKLYDYQEELVRMCMGERRVLLLAARQMGKTQTVSMYLLWCALFLRDQTILIASKDDGHAQEIMDRIRYAYEELPHWLKAGVKFYNKHNIVFENGSRIISKATTKKTGRGLAISILYLDELAFVDTSVQTAMWRSLSPTLSTGGKAIISSTPNGDTDLFANLWRIARQYEEDQEAEVQTNVADVGLVKDKRKASPFKTMFIPWHRHPDRGEEYLKQMKIELGEVGLRQEVFCEFISSDATLFDSLKMLHIKVQEPVGRNLGFRLWCEDSELWGNKQYIVGIDPATGAGKDFTVIEVFEFPSLVQVMELRLNTVSIPLIYSKIKWLFKFLRRPGADGKRAEIFWSFERNGIGEALVAMIQNDDDPSGGVYIDGTTLYNEDQQRPDRLGCYTTGKTKLLACMQFKNLIESGHIKIRSSTLFDEMKNFIAIGNTYKAKDGWTDDCVMSMLIITKVIRYLSHYDETARKLMYESIDPDSDAPPEDVDQYAGNVAPIFF